MISVVVVGLMTRLQVALKSKYSPTCVWKGGAHCHSGETQAQCVVEQVSEDAIDIIARAPSNNSDACLELLREVELQLLNLYENESLR